MQTKQRGSGWSIKLVYNLYRIFGYKFIYFLMYPVTFFYFLFATNVYNSLKIFYNQLDIPFTKRVYFKHLYIFAICMTDRFISKFSPKSYECEYVNEKELIQTLSSGSILLLSHFGGWATAANKVHINKKINIVMQEVLLKNIKEIEDSIENNSTSNINIIDLGQGGIASSIQIVNALQNEEVVAIMADRANDKKYNYFVPFFKDLAGFNKNPFQIAYKTKKPLITLFAVHIKAQHYKIINFLIPINYELKENEAIHEAITFYAKELENMLKQNPTQWFNFYNFWEKQ